MTLKARIVKHDGRWLLILPGVGYFYTRPLWEACIWALNRICVAQAAERATRGRR